MSTNANTTTTGWVPVFETFDGPNDPRRCTCCGGSGLYDEGHLECEACDGRGTAGS